MKMLEAIVIHRPSRWFIKDSPTNRMLQNQSKISFAASPFIIFQTLLVSLYATHNHNQISLHNINKLKPDQ